MPTYEVSCIVHKESTRHSCDHEKCNQACRNERLQYAHNFFLRRRGLRYATPATNIPIMMRACVNSFDCPNSGCNMNTNGL